LGGKSASIFRGTKVRASFSERVIIAYGRTEPHYVSITNRAARVLTLDEIKNEMGRARRTHGKQEGYIQGFCGGLGEETLGRPRHRWGIILKWFFKKRDEGLDWTNLAQDRDRWRALVKAVMKLRVQLNAGKFLIGRGAVSVSKRTLIHTVT